MGTRVLIGEERQGREDRALIDGILITSMDFERRL